MLELRPDVVVAEKLRLVRPLGQGGMGSVWLAHHEALDMEVAVKFVRPDRAASDPSLRTRFEREAKAAARITSPHVVQIKDYGVADGTTPYIVMERLEGKTLKDLLDVRGRLAAQVVAGLVVGVASALDRAHAIGVVHRDIKPHNIFMVDAPDGADPIPKVLDFGVAKVVDDARAIEETGLTETGMVIGSPPYMSPEQLEGRRDVDHRTDIWSLAIVAYQALTGALPFEGGSSYAVGAAVLAGRYAPVTSLRASLPKTLDHWFAKALCADPDGRFESAGALAARFVSILEDGDVPSSIEPDVAALAARDVDALAHATTEDHAIPMAAADAVTQTAASPAPRPAPEGETASSVSFERRTPAPRRAHWRWVLGLAGIAGAVAGGGYLYRSRTTTPATPTPTSMPSLPPGTCPEGMTFVPGGTFAMGSRPGDDVPKNETPRHDVNVAPFCLDTTEVTVAAYTSCAACGPPPKTVEGKEITQRAQTFWSRFCNGGREDRADHPMNCVSWNQAQAYCAAQGRRLPTEEEWEHAARGGDGRAFPWGAEPPGPSRLNACGAECGETLTALLAAIGNDGGWGRMYEARDPSTATAPVAAFPAGVSAHGVHDLAGNVWEWTASSYCYYDEQNCIESRRVLRGGGWDIPNPEAVRATRRHAGAPNGRGHNIGFRCAMSARGS